MMNNFTDRLARYIIITVCLIALLSIVILPGCTDEITGNSDSQIMTQPTNLREEDVMIGDRRNLSGLMKPSIDRDIPQNLETATLAMG